MRISLLALLGPLVAAVLIVGLRRVPAIIAVGGALVGVGGASVGLLDTAAGGLAALEFGGLPHLPLRLELTPLTTELSLTVAIVALLVLVYGVGYMQDSSVSDQARFFAQMAFFVAAMQGVVLAGDWLLLLASWELMGLASYLLIGFWFDRPAVATAATRAFVTTRATDLAMYVAVFALVTRAGTTNIGATLTANHADLAIGLLLVVAAMGKAAQVPFQGWLQDAMLGPTPVSGLLHSATLVAAGAILLIRTVPLFSEATLLAVGLAGGLTILLTGVTALAQPDLKRLLAASTSSQLGFMFLAVGAGSPVAALVHLVAHAAMKAALFLGAGIFQHAVESTAFEDLHGVGRAYPRVFGLFVLAGLALAGVPPLAGFWSKDAIEAATAQSPAAPVLLPVALLGSAFTGAYVARMLRILWFGSAFTRQLPGLHWMVTALTALALLAATLGLAFARMAQLLGPRVPDEVLSRLLGVSAALVGLGAGWSGMTERLVVPIGGWAASGFRLGNGWFDFAVRPALALASTCDRIDTRIDQVSVDVAAIGVRLASASRQFDEAELDGAIARLVQVTRGLAARARSLQSGFVSRELLLAACGAAAVLLVALVAR